MLANIIRLSLLSMLLSSSILANETSSDLYMKSQVIKYYNSYYNSLRLFVGTGNNSDKISLDFEISLGRSNVIIGNNEKVGWGIDCGADTEDVKSTCIYNSVNIILHKQK